MGMDYIRTTYGVPARRGGRIEYTDSNGAKWRGTILSARGAHLSVLLDGMRARSLLHPTWNVRYVPDLVPNEQN